MDYTWLSLTEAENQLAARLADPDHIQWTLPELDLYIQDALRFWNCLTNNWKTDFGFSNLGPLVWSKFWQLPDSPRLRTVTDVDVYTLMEYMLTEPPTGGTWTGTPQFDINDLSGALQRRRDEILQITNCNQTIIYAPGTPNVRRFFVADNTIEIQRIRWPVNIQEPPAAVTAFELSPTAPGNFQVAHNLGLAPFFVLVTMSSSGEIWLQPTGSDATNLYFVASDADITATAYVWTQPADAMIPFTTVDGDFSMAHGLGSTPFMGFIELDSGVAVWFQSTPWDDTNVYLVGDDIGFTGRVILFTNPPPYINALKNKTLTATATTTDPIRVVHGLGAKPDAVILRPESSGVFWVTGFDETYIYLQPSEAGVSTAIQTWLLPVPTVTGTPHTLVRDDTMAMELFFDEYYQQPSGSCEAWMVADEPPLSFNVEPAPSIEGDFELLVDQAGGAFTPPNPTLLGIPDDFAWLARWGALADLFGRESEATDRLRAAWCQKRYEDGMKLLVNTPWIMLGRINNVATDVPTFVDMDRYQPEWDSDPTNIDVVVSAGVDFLASPIGAQAFVTVLGNAPFVNTAGFVQVSRSVWDAILTYAQFLATFKMGGAEFQQALELEKIFLATAMEENVRLRKLGIYTDALLERAGGENREQERA